MPLAGAVFFASYSAGSPTRCPVVRARPNRSGCSYANGVGQCFFDFIQPDFWGKCIQAEDQTFFCKNKGEIKHYSSRDAILGRWKIAACPALAGQIDEKGQEPNVPVLIIPIEPPAEQGPKT
jgi:hypothetical protein